MPFPDIRYLPQNQTPTDIDLQIFISIRRPATSQCASCTALDKPGFRDAQERSVIQGARCAQKPLYYLPDSHIAILWDHTWKWSTVVRLLNLSQICSDSQLKVYQGLSLLLI